MRMSPSRQAVQCFWCEPSSGSPASAPDSSWVSARAPSGGPLGWIPDREFQNKFQSHIWNHIKNCPLSVLTPCIPISNASLTVSCASFRRIREEAKRALDLLVFHKQTNNEPWNPWNEIFQPFHLLDKTFGATRFLVFQCSHPHSPSLSIAEEHLGWIDTIWARLPDMLERYREFLCDIEGVTVGLIEASTIPIQVFLYPKRWTFESSSSCSSDQVGNRMDKSVYYVIGIRTIQDRFTTSVTYSLTYTEKPVLPLQDALSNFEMTIHGHPKRATFIMKKVHYKNIDLPILFLK